MVGLCRLCASLRKMDVLIMIKDDSNEICEKLRNCCQVNIKLKDALPKSICQECMEHLNNSHKFYKKVKEAQETLQALYPTANINEENDEQIQTCSLVETLSSVQENVKKRKISTTQQNKLGTPKGSENKQKQIKLEKSPESVKLGNENPPLNIIEQIYEELEMTKDEEEAIVEQLETIDEDNIEDLAQKDVEEQVFNDNDDEVADKREELLDQEVMEENYNESAIEDVLVENNENNDSVLLTVKDLNDELEYVDIYEETEEDEDMEVEEIDNGCKQEENRSSLNSCLKLKSWKNYNYLCFICNITVPNFITLKNHINQIHNITQIDNFKYKCYDCQKTIPRYNFFLNHVRSKHHPDLKLKCEVCDLSCQNFEELSHHRSVNCVEANNYGSIVPCNQCFKSFHNIDGLQNHQKFVQSNEKVKLKYQCEECNKEFQYKSCLKNHLKTHGERNTFSCSFCGNIYYTKISLEQHMFCHLDVKTYKCNICGKSFKSFLTLDQHYIVHSDEKPFKCDYCDKTFHKKIQKITHERTHTGEMPFACDTCDKRFSFLSALNAHLKCHTGVKPYSCEYCDKTFADSSNRNKHIRRKHAKEIKS